MSVFGQSINTLCNAVDAFSLFVFTSFSIRVRHFGILLYSFCSAISFAFAKIYANTVAAVTQCFYLLRSQNPYSISRYLRCISHCNQATIAAIMLFSNIEKFLWYFSSWSFYTQTVFVAWQDARDEKIYLFLLSFFSSHFPLFVAFSCCSYCSNTVRWTDKENKPDINFNCNVCECVCTKRATTWIFYSMRFLFSPLTLATNLVWPTKKSLASAQPNIAHPKTTTFTREKMARAWFYLTKKWEKTRFR